MGCCWDVLHQTSKVKTDVIVFVSPILSFYPHKGLGCIALHGQSAYCLVAIPSEHLDLSLQMLTSLPARCNHRRFSDGSDTNAAAKRAMGSTERMLAPDGTIGISMGVGLPPAPLAPNQLNMPVPLTPHQLNMLIQLHLLMIQQQYAQMQAAMQAQQMQQMAAQQQQQQQQQIQQHDGQQMAGMFMGSAFVDGTGPQQPGEEEEQEQAR